MNNPRRQIFSEIVNVTAVFSPATVLEETTPAKSGPPEDTD